jgi:hypothetical protein
MEDNLEISLIHYSDNELIKIVYEFYEWDEDMLVAVQNELTFRGKLPDDIIYKKYNEILKEDAFLSEGKEATFPQQFLGWIGIVGVLGIIIGYELYFSKTKSHFTAKEYFKYNEDSRESGRYMFYISLAVVVGFFVYKFANFIERY